MIQQATNHSGKFQSTIPKRPFWTQNLVTVEPHHVTKRMESTKWRGALTILPSDVPVDDGIVLEPLPVPVFTIKS
jgi:hypothetical protein